MLICFKAYEFHEEVEPVISLKQSSISANALALDLAHTAAFHTGLGAPLYPTSTTPIGAYLNESSVANFAQAVYNKANIAVVADGATQAGLAKWIEPFFKSVPASGSSQLGLNTAASKYFGGEQRSSRVGDSAYVIAFPGASLAENKPETSVLVALLGGESSISWTPGFTLLSKAAAAAPYAHAHASNIAYSDAGLLTIQVSGPSNAVRKVTEESVKALRSIANGSVSKEDVKKAIANAKFNLLAAPEISGTGITAAGSNLVHGDKALSIAEAIKGLESVTAEKLKAVSNALHGRYGIG